MAHSVLTFFRNNPQTLLGSLNKLKPTPSVFNNAVRTLYAKSTLGFDGFCNQQQKTQQQMYNIVDKFKEKMTEYSKEETNHMIFTEDLKNMIHLAENESDLEIVTRMIKKFNQQNQQLRFGNFVFGPVVMRLLYLFNKTELALELFNAPELSGFFDQLISYQILMDMLYEAQKYDDVVKVFETVIEKQLGVAKYPKNCVVLLYAALFKKNTPESLEYGLKLWRDLTETGHLPMRRATTFCAGLALNQGKPEAAIEILVSARNQNYTTVRNIKVAALADLGRAEDALPVLKSILNEDTPANTVHTFNKDVLERVKNAVIKYDSSELTLEFNRLEQTLQNQGNISNITLNEQLCSEIQQPPRMNSRTEDNRYQQREVRNPTSRIKSYAYRQRPGLNELH